MAPTRWTNVTRLSLIVDVENDEVVHYVPMGVRQDDHGEPA